MEVCHERIVTAVSGAVSSRTSPAADPRPFARRCRRAQWLPAAVASAVKHWRWNNLIEYSIRLRCADAHEAFLFAAQLLDTQPDPRRGGFGFDSISLDDELRVQHFYNELDALMR